MEKGFLHCVLELYSTHLMPKLWFKVLAMVLMVVLTVLGALGSSQIKQDFSMRFFVPTDNPLWSFFNAQDKHFGDVGAPVSIVTGKADYSTLAAQQEMRQMLIDIDNCNKAGGQCSGDWILPGTVDSWHSAFVTWVGTCSATVSDQRCFPARGACKDDWSPLMAQMSKEWSDTPLESCADLKPRCKNIPDQVNPCRKTCNIGCGTADKNDIATTATSVQKSGTYYNGPRNQWDCDYTSGYGPEQTPNPCYEVKLNDDGYTVPPEKFLPWLIRFLNETRAGGRYKSSVQWEVEHDPECEGIRSTRSRATYAAVQTAKDEIDSMRDLRRVVDKPDNLGYLYPFFYGFIFYEQYAVIIYEGLQNLCLALAAVFLICFALLTHLGATLLVVLTILMIDVEIVGLMYVWGVTLDSVSVTNLVLAVGLAVDYSVHVAHAFLLAPGRDRNDRVKLATLEMGVPVLHGAVSTFCAVVLLSAAGSYIFQVFFKMFFAICLFGVLNGLLMLPIILSVIGPGQMRITAPKIPDSLANKINKTKGQDFAQPSKHEPSKHEPEFTSNTKVIFSQSPRAAKIAPAPPSKAEPNMEFADL